MKRFHTFIQTITSKQVAAMKFKFCWGAVFALLSSPLLAATLTGVESAALPGDAVEIKHDLTLGTDETNN